MVTGIIHRVYSRNCLKTRISGIIYEDINEYKPKLSRIVIEMGFYKDYSSKRIVCINSFNESIAQRSRDQLTTPVSPPSQGGDKRGGKNLPKLALMKMGKRNFYTVIL